jgi:hypothetical protein
LLPVAVRKGKFGLGLIVLESQVGIATALIQLSPTEWRAQEIRKIAVG